MVISQAFGIGDILFLEPIYKYFSDRGERPILPVRDHLIWLKDYITTAEIIPMSQCDPAMFEWEQRSRVFAARFANQICRGYDPHDHHDIENMMNDKYLLAGLSPMMWRSLDIKFNERKCLQLMEDLTGKTDWDDYVLVNEDCGVGKIKIHPETDLPIIRMREIPGYTVLDWAFMMLHAAENHHVSTSTFYIFQAIKNKYGFSGKVVIYPRPNEDGLRGIEKLNPSFNFETCSAEK